MHDSRGAPLKIGDRVLIEAEVTDVQPSDTGYCNVSVRTVTPEQMQGGADSKPPMSPQTLTCNTRWLTKVGAALVLAMLGLLLSSAPAEAAGRWVKSCNGRTCQMTWVEDRPAKSDAYCTCQNCSCMATGRATSACAANDCARQRSVLVPRAHQDVAGCASCSSGGSGGGGWYFGKNVGRAKPRRRQ